METKTIKENLDLAKAISDKMVALKKTLPYHLNIIDELHINENAHSRILSKLLQYQENGHYTFLEKFFEHCNLPLQPEKPEITTEKQRIDILIMDKSAGYAVIIENKVNYAGDQNAQIKRYVDKVKNNGIAQDKIYVLYLTRWGRKIASENSLPNDLKNELGDRYVPINFNNHILPWLNSLIGFCRFKDTQLIAAMQQYTDFIKGFLNQRNDTQKIYQIMKEDITKLLKLRNKNRIEKYHIIDEKLDEIANLQNQLNNMKNELANTARKAFFEKLYHKLNQNFPGWEYRSAVINPVSSFDEAFDRPYFGMAYNPKELAAIKKVGDKELVLSIELQNDKGGWKSFLCGIFTYNDPDIQSIIISDFFGEYGLNKETTNNWVYLHRNSYVFDDANIGFNVNDPKWDLYFIEQTDKVVDVFYDQVVKVLEAWKKYIQQS